MKCDVCGHACGKGITTCPVCGSRVGETADDLRAKSAEQQRDLCETNVRITRTDEQKKARAKEQQKEEASAKKSREESERKSREESERKARAEAERKAREEAERKIGEEAERRAREEVARRLRLEAEIRASEEDHRRRIEAERKAREKAERKAREEAERRERAEAALRAQRNAEAALRAQRNAEREAAQRAEEERTRREARSARICCMAFGLLALFGAVIFDFSFIPFIGPFLKAGLLLLSMVIMLYGLGSFTLAADWNDGISMQMVLFFFIGIIWSVSAIPVVLTSWGIVTKCFCLAALVLALASALLHTLVNKVYSSLEYFIVQAVALVLFVALCAVMLSLMRTAAGAGQILAAFGPAELIDSAFIAVWLLHFTTRGFYGTDEEACLALQIVFAIGLALIGVVVYLFYFGFLNGLQMYARAFGDVAKSAVQILFG